MRAETVSVKEYTCEFCGETSRNEKYMERHENEHREREAFTMENQPRLSVGDIVRLTDNGRVYRIYKVALGKNPAKDGSYKYCYEYRMLDPLEREKNGDPLMLYVPDFGKDCDFWKNCSLLMKAFEEDELRKRLNSETEKCGVSLDEFMDVCHQKDVAMNYG